jgi:hypothetical protein
LSCSDCSAICLDFGNFTVQSDRHQINKKEKERFEDAQVLNMASVFTNPIFSFLGDIPGNLFN